MDMLVLIIFCVVFIMYIVLSIYLCFFACKSKKGKKRQYDNSLNNDDMENMKNPSARRNSIRVTVSKNREFEGQYDK